MALSTRQAVSVCGGAAPDGDTPMVGFAGGSLVCNITRSDRPVVPYVSGGLGVVHVADHHVATYALAPKTTHSAGMMGGGIRWFPMPHWGVRADYRLFVIRNDLQPSAARRVIRSAHRVYGALVMTF